MYVILNIETGKYVARPGSARSYVTNLQHARTFPTREAADRECCGNERVLSLVEEIGHR